MSWYYRLKQRQIICCFHHQKRPGLLLTNDARPGMIHILLTQVTQGFKRVNCNVLKADNNIFWYILGFSLENVAFHNILSMQFSNWFSPFNQANLQIRKVKQIFWWQTKISLFQIPNFIIRLILFINQFSTSKA